MPVFVQCSKQVELNYETLTRKSPRMKVVQDLMLISLLLLSYISHMSHIKMTCQMKLHTTQNKSQDAASHPRQGRKTLSSCEPSTHGSYAIALETLLLPLSHCLLRFLSPRKLFIKAYCRQRVLSVSCMHWFTIINVHDYGVPDHCFHKIVHTTICFHVSRSASTHPTVFQWIHTPRHHIYQHQVVKRRTDVSRNLRQFLLSWMVSNPMI